MHLLLILAMHTYYHLFYCLRACVCVEEGWQTQLNRKRTGSSIEANDRRDTHQWGYNHVEVPQVHILGTAELWCKHCYQHLEVLRPLSRVAGQVPQHRI